MGIILILQNEKASTQQAFRAEDALTSVSALVIYMCVQCRDVVPAGKRDSV